MFIETLGCQNFRNYELLDISFGQHTNILYGENAQGKTNILEAIYMAATSRSHRGAKDKQMIQFESDEAHIKMIVNKMDVNHRIDMHLRKNGKKGVAIDRVNIRKMVDLFGMSSVIMFSPEDLDIVKDGPSERRKFMNAEISQMSGLYFSDFQNYKKIIDQRNKLLKQIYFEPRLKDTLDIWDEQLATVGESIIRERKNFIFQMNQMIQPIHEELTGGREKIEIRYEPDVEEKNFRQKLLDKRETDLRYSSTSVGPHRDDFGIFINDKDVRIYGSQGQQRTSAISIKLTEIDMLKQLKNDEPILLLDDVMSELDGNRRDALLSKISNIQTIITCAGYDDFIRNQVKADKIYRVENGKIIDETIPFANGIGIK